MNNIYSYSPFNWLKTFALKSWPTDTERGHIILCCPLSFYVLLEMNFFFFKGFSCICIFQCTLNHLYFVWLWAFPLCGQDNIICASFTFNPIHIIKNNNITVSYKNFILACSHQLHGAGNITVLLFQVRGYGSEKSDDQSRVMKPGNKWQILYCIKPVLLTLIQHMGFPSGSAVKNAAANTGDTSLIPGSGRSPREGNGNPLQYSCLGNPMDRRAWWATVHGVAKDQTWLSE